MPKSQTPFYDANDKLRPKFLERNEKDLRSEFSRDLSRLVHCNSFRKLTGKTQIFPSDESDYFRNRLTHSIEVADIGNSLALRANENKLLKNNKITIDLDLMRFACLAHDIGHPPFGHVGERALNDCMREFGGFEGNAQSLRILSRIEKKQTLEDITEHYQNHGVIDGKDYRIGLNLCYRSYAAILKYDSPIWKAPNVKDVNKGYYLTEAELVNDIKINVLKKYFTSSDNLTYSDSRRIKNIELKTLECSLMDLADDIAYTTFDLDDALKSEFINPFDLINIYSDSPIKKPLYEKLNKIISKNDEIKKFVKQFLKTERAKKKPSEDEKTESKPGKRKTIPAIKDIKFGEYDSFLDTFLPTKFAGIFFGMNINTEFTQQLEKMSQDSNNWIFSSGLTYRHLDNYKKNGYFRNALSSHLVQTFLDGLIIENKEFPDYPVLWKATLEAEALFTMECIKQFVYVSQVRSNRVQLKEFRGQKMVKDIFDTLLHEIENPKFDLLPSDYKAMYLSFGEGKKDRLKRRVVCDFIASMSDRYALEYYIRLFGENPQTMFKNM